MRRDFEEALKEAESSRSEATLRPGAAYRLEQAILEGKVRRAPWAGRALALAGVAALAALATVVALQVSDSDEQTPAGVIAEAPVPQPAGQPEQVAEPAPGPAPAAAEERVLAAGTTWQTPERVTVVSQSRAVVARAPEGLRVVEGAAHFDVDTRAADEADVVVAVSHGLIQVLGTEFTVVQRDGGGEVTLHEGRIRFTHEDGTQVVMAPGDTVTWPRAEAEAEAEWEVETEVAEVLPAPIPVPAPQRQVAPKPRAAPVDVPALISRVETLRQQGRFEEAVGSLQGTLSGPLPDETHERLSYELGDILTFQLRDRARGCEVWSRHVARFGNSGRYAGAVKSAQRALGCP